MTPGSDGIMERLRAACESLRSTHLASIALRQYDAGEVLRRHESELRAANEHYRTFLRLSSEGIARLEAVDPVPVDAQEDVLVEAVVAHMRIAECNDVWARIFGFGDPAVLVGRMRAEVSPAIPIEVARAFVREGFRLERQALPVSMPDIGIFVHVQAVGIVENGRLTGLWSVLRDVSA